MGQANTDMQTHNMVRRIRTMVQTHRRLHKISDNAGNIIFELAYDERYNELRSLLIAYRDGVIERMTDIEESLDRYERMA